MGKERIRWQSLWILVAKGSVGPRDLLGNVQFKDTPTTIVFGKVQGEGCVLTFTDAGRALAYVNVNRQKLPPDDYVAIELTGPSDCINAFGPFAESGRATRIAFGVVAAARGWRTAKLADFLDDMREQLLADIRKQRDV